MKFSLSKKQKLLSLIILALVLVISLLFLIIKNNNQKKISKQNNGSNSTISTIMKPVFLDNAEKASLNIRPENKIQVIKRNAQGKVELYKVINNDRDIITDLNQITPTILPAKK